MAVAPNELGSLQKGSIADLASKPEPANNKVTIVVFSGEMDRALAAFVIASAAAGMGWDVTMFFTFWGLNILKKPTGPKKGAATLLGKAFEFLMPKSAHDLPISKFNMGGIGAKLMVRQMKSKNVQTLPEMMEMARELGVKIIGCGMSMDVMEIPPEDLVGVSEVVGAATFLKEAAESKVTLFV